MSGVGLSLLDLCLRLGWFERMGSVQEEKAEGREPSASVSVRESAATHDFAHAITLAERRRAFAALCVSSFCTGAGQSVIYTILPPLGRQLGLSPFQITVIFAVSAAIWIFSSAFWGARSDRWGRKPVILLGMIAFAVSFGAFAGTMLAGLRDWLPVFMIFPLLIAARCVYGAFGSGTSAAAQAYVADRTTPKERLRGIALVGMAFALGITFGPVIGSALSYVSLLSPFYLISALALASAVGIYLFLPERMPPKVHRPERSNLRWYEPRILPFVIFGVSLSLIASVPTQTVGFFLQDVLRLDAQRTAQLTGIGLMAAAAAALVAQFAIVQRFHVSARLLTAAGLVLAGVSNALFLISHDFATIVLALVLSGFGFGMARPGFTSGVSLSVKPHEQGTVAGLLSAATAAGFIFSPLIGWLYELSPYLPYAVGTVAMLGMIAAQFLSPVLYHAGDIPADAKSTNEAAKVILPNG
jgi:MFS family permease